VSLVSLSSIHIAESFNTLTEKLALKFPETWDTFVHQDLMPNLAPEVEAYYKTTDFSLVYDYRPFFLAARQLGIEKYVSVDENGPAIGLSHSLLKWRENKTIRQFIEWSLLCGISRTIIAADLRRIYSFDVNEDDLVAFEELFADKTFACGNYWMDYIRCIGESDAMRLRKLMNEPRDFVRWKLGVPITLDSDQVLDRLISDAYYTERAIKHNAGEKEALRLSKEELARIKLERETIFKGLDRRVKLRELSATQGEKSNTDAAQEIRKIVLEFATHDFPVKSDVLGTETPPSLDDLKAENDRQPDKG